MHRRSVLAGSGLALAALVASCASSDSSTTEEQLNPPEFRYWDEATRYEIEYRNETHLLLTYSSEGCEPG